MSWLRAPALAALDAAMVYVAFRFAAKVQRLRDTRLAPDGNLPAHAFSFQIAAVAGGVLLAFVFFKLYIQRRGLARIDLLFALIPAVLFGFGAALAASSLIGFELSRATFI